MKSMRDQPLKRSNLRSRGCGFLLRILVCGVFGVASLLAVGPAESQGWEDDGWGTSGSASSGSSAYDDSPPATRWSLRAGIGFTTDPDNFLMNFELPYRFDQYVSAGPMIQVGVADHRSLVATTANLTITVPELPGESLQRFHPMVFAGIGFAVLENKDRAGSNRSAGFLANAGFGLDYALSARTSVGSRMIFNFLPDRTLDEVFFYSWEMIGIKFSF
jgi:hypothetical protein